MEVQKTKPTLHNGSGGAGRGELGLRPPGRWLADRSSSESARFGPATSVAGHTGLNHLRWVFMPYLASSCLVGQKVWCLFGALSSSEKLSSVCRGAYVSRASRCQRECREFESHRGPADRQRMHRVDQWPFVRPSAFTISLRRPSLADHVTDPTF